MLHALPVSEEYQDIYPKKGLRCME